MLYIIFSVGNKKVEKKEPPPFTTRAQKHKLKEKKPRSPSPEPEQELDPEPQPEEEEEVEEEPVFNGGSFYHIFHCKIFLNNAVFNVYALCLSE